MRMTEEALEALLKKRKGWTKGGQVGAAPAPAGAPIAQPKQRKVKLPKEESPIEALFAQQLELAGIKDFERELKDYIPGRKHRLDFGNRERRIGVEIQGMAHRIKGRFKADIEKRALALLAGWRILEVGGAEVRSGQALQWVQELLAQ